MAACRGKLQAFLTGGGFGRGGAIRARAGSDGIVFSATASRCYAMSAGGVAASEGKLVGVNLTFSRNTAASGAAVHCAGGTNLFAGGATPVFELSRQIDVPKGAATGLTLEGGFAHVDSPYMQLQPTNPNDGGAGSSPAPRSFPRSSIRSAVPIPS